ncbi:MAG TPA: bifunctional phosphoglucose/phosphomannose isomerase [Candidatus Thermoplasmatota archaeon]|nr:bifunctional phosphoglucose/phosphomannose isomerase [Candidatus Thermoplasmatota archaeon]
MLDLPEDKIRAVDASNMLGTIHGSPEMLERALAAFDGKAIRPARKVRRVVIVGMGGSAMGGDYLAAWAALEGTAPVEVVRTYALPAYVDADTLVLAISYSGNTEETLAAFAEAHRRGAMVAAIATGNKLEALAKKHGAPFVRIEGGHQPRAALPILLATSALVLEAYGVIKARAALTEALPDLRALAADLAPEAGTARNEAKRIALALQDSVPIVYGADELVPAARRFANELNENSKILGFWGAMPEMNHNELVGWAGDDDLDRFTAIFLRREQEHPQIKERYDFTGHLIQERGGRLVQIQAKGKGFVTAMLTATYVGDMVSGYLAVLRGKDPSPVEIITRLKNKLGETGFVDTVAK